MLGALVLAGGEGKRVGRNKALIEFRGKPLLLHVVEKVIKIACEINVVVGKNDEIDDYVSILPSSVKVLTDTVSGKGPLAGILTGMENMHSEYVIILPCDSPFVKRGVLEHLIHVSRGADAAIPRWPNGYIEPLHAVYRLSSSFHAAKAALKEKEQRVVDMIKRLDRIIYVSTDELRRFDQNLITFFNINSREDLRTAERVFQPKNLT